MLDNFKIFNSIPDELAIIDAEGVILFVNRAWETFSEENMGLEAQKSIGRNYLNVCGDARGNGAKSASDATFGIKNVINGELPVFELEYPCDSPNEKRWYVLRASPVSTYPELTLLTHTNITKRKIAELKVSRENDKTLVINERLKSTLHNIVHDIRNPLSSIIALVSLSRSESDHIRMEEYLEMIDISTTKLLSFVSETLQYVSTLDFIKPVDVESILDEYLESIAQLLKSNSINAIIDIKQNGEFNTNSIEFRSILSNLIGNSIKYIDEKKNDKSIQITFSSDDSKGILKIEDNGIGINKKEIPKLTEQNYQVNKSSSDGKGLGLYMVNKSVVLLGGTLRIRSDFGIGSEVIIEIPNSRKDV